MNPLHTVVDYFRTSKAELEKVSWPSREATIRYSALVVVASVVAAAFFGTLDFALSRGVEAVISRNAPAAVPPTQEVPLTQPTTEPSLPINLVPTDVQATTPNGQKADVNITQ